MVVYFTILAFSFFLIAYLLKVLKTPFHQLAESSLSVVDSLMSDLEEDEKVQLVQKNINKLLVALFKSFLVVTVAGLAGVAVLFLYTLYKDARFENIDLSSSYTIIAISVGSTVGFLIPVKQKQKSSYSALSQLLHRMALNNYNIAYKLFKVERKKINKQQLQLNNKFIIVSGLARSGTTSIMNKLSENNMFVSLSYANMPFLTCPNLWGKIYKPKSKQLKERSHKDGLKIGLDSAEALEEYFFKALAKDSYIQEASLSEYSIPEKDYADYLKYQTIIKLNNDKIYLAKNNNFILRYNSIRELNKDFIIVITFRDPIAHASSLLEKHLYYTNMQTEDNFVLEYMNWLGHHEFGQNQKPFQFSNINTTYTEDKNKLDYWLQIWMNYYKHILTINKHNVVYINYDFYCSNPKEVLNEIYLKLGINIELPNLPSFINKRKTESDCSENLKSEAYKIYEELKQLV